MDSKDWNHKNNIHQLNAIFGKAKLIATCDAVENNMLVFFSSRAQLERAKKSIETYHTCTLQKGPFEDSEGCHGLWVPVKIDKLMNKETGQRQIIKTIQSDYLEAQAHLGKIPSLHAKTPLEFHERLNTAMDKIQQAYKEKFDVRGMN